MGTLPLHIAAYQGHSAVSEKLLAARCNVDLLDKNESTPLHIASFNGHAAVTKQLIAARDKHATAATELQQSYGPYATSV
jgi:ankyrin repeat protein